MVHLADTCVSAHGLMYVLSTASHPTSRMPGVDVMRVRPSRATDVASYHCILLVWIN